jgi:two-component system autoinducer 2 sensor kinase/phosphatase LuxQ
LKKKLYLGQLGFTCDDAADGVEAVEKCSTKNFDLVLMDNVMPRMTGVEATPVIRRREKHKRQLAASNGDELPKPVLIFGITGNALTEDVEEFKESGCDEVLTKPLKLKELKRCLVLHGLLAAVESQPPSL